MHFDNACNFSLQNKIKTVLDAGCGSGGPMVKLLKNGFKVKGFDFSASMVKAAKEELARNGFSPDLVFQSDLEKGGGLPKEKFDAALAFGVFPHILNASTNTDGSIAIYTPGLKLQNMFGINLKIGIIIS